MVLVDRLRSAAPCEACGGAGMRTATLGPKAGRADYVAACTRCAGTGSPLRARVELAAYAGDAAARAALGAPWDGEHASGLRALTFSDWTRGLSRWADVGPVPGMVPRVAADAVCNLAWVVEPGEVLAREVALNRVRNAAATAPDTTDWIAASWRFVRGEQPVRDAVSRALVSWALGGDS